MNQAGSRAMTFATSGLTATACALPPPVHLSRRSFRAKADQHEPAMRSPPFAEIRGQTPGLAVSG